MATSYIFACSKCGMQVRSNSQPSSSGCPSGGWHSWQRTTVYNYHWFLG